MRAIRLAGAAGLFATAGILAACAGGQVSTELGTVGEPPDIMASGLAFDRDELSVSAGAAAALVFENRDTAPHNVTIYADASGSQTLFVGEIFGGPGSRTYHLPALSPGTYFFRCDVHQDMRGTIVATP